MKKARLYTRFAGFAMFLLWAPCGAFAFAPAGYWQMDKETVIEFKPCDEKLCGYLVFFGEDSNVKDERNPVAEKRTRPLCNLAFITGLKFETNRYSGGKLYDPESGETYDVNLTVEGKEIKMRVYAGLPALGETIKLTVLPVGPPKKCQVQPSLGCL